MYEVVIKKVIEGVLVGVLEGVKKVSEKVCQSRRYLMTNSSINIILLLLPPIHHSDPHR